MTWLGILARYWQAGVAKTRLAATVGPAHASRFQEACVRTLATRLATTGDQRFLVITPASQREAFDCFCPPWSAVPQADGDLGQRMAAFFSTAAAAGADRAILIGSDSPTIPRVYIESGFELLRHRRVVLGPACDGGYYLIGCQTPAPALFDNIAWGTADVWRQTIERLTQLKLSRAELSSWYDVDDLPGLLRLQGELQHDPIDDALTALRRVVDEALSTVPAKLR